MKIVVTLCTRQRPIMLKDCLQSLVAQRVPDGVSLSIAVVENNETAACRHIVEEIAARPGAPRIDYKHEPRLGIPIARNRGLEMALAQGADWIGFIDDDEVADPEWISCLEAASRTLNADVLQGPVERINETGAPVRPRLHRETGFALETAGTNNTLMRARLVQPDGMGLRFNEERRFTGGTDIEFFGKAYQLGASIQWVDDAVVRELVPAERLTLRWRLKRARQTGSAYTRNHVLQRGRLYAFLRHMPEYLRRLGQTCVVLPLGLMLFPVVPKQGFRLISNGLRQLWWMAGSFSATFNVGAPQPYKTIEGY
jgi:succinoglycan biosynthesis protein ExoM